MMEFAEGFAWYATDIQHLRIHSVRHINIWKRNSRLFEGCMGVGQVPVIFYSCPHHGSPGEQTAAHIEELEEDVLRLAHIACLALIEESSVSLQ